MKASNWGRKPIEAGMKMQTNDGGATWDTSESAFIVSDTRLARFDNKAETPLGLIDQASSLLVRDTSE